MCQFFSLVSDGQGKPYYFDWKLRKQILSGKIKLQSADSHTSIADYFGFKGADEDKLNKWEYNPITKILTQDVKGQCDNDHDKIYEFCKELDFKEIIPQLNIHPIVHPFKDLSILEGSDSDLKLLKKWASVWASVWDSVRASVWVSVGDSVWASVGASVRDSVRDSVWASVRASVGDSVWDSVGASVRDSVRASVWASVGDSVGAYISSYFSLPKWEYIKHKKGVNPHQPCIDLWNKGIVPSFDGKLWRLHGKDGKIIHTISQEDLKKIK